MKENNTQQQETAGKSMGASWEGGEGEGMAMMPPKFGVTAGRGEMGESKPPLPKAKTLFNSTFEVTNGVFQVLISTIKEELIAEFKSNGDNSIFGVETNILFRPNRNAPDSQDIRLIQVAQGVNLNGEIEYDQPDKTRISGNEKTVICEKGQTYYDISKTITGGHISAEEIAEKNGESPFKTFLGGEKITVPLSRKGASIDYLRESDKGTLKPRKKESDPNVSPGYAEGHPKKSFLMEAGHKLNDQIKSARIKDEPRTNLQNFHYEFETVARAFDKGLDFGTIHWGFDIINGEIKNLKVFVVESVSQNFQDSLSAFNKFMKNKHIVMHGESLEEISELYFGTSDKVKKIIEANPELANGLIPGTEINIPNVSAR